MSNADTIHVTFDRANEYCSVINSKNTIDVLVITECCVNKCSTKLSRFQLADFRCTVISNLNGPLRANKVRDAIDAELRRRCTPREDGCVDIETTVHGVPLCLTYFYRVLGIGRVAVESSVRRCFESAAFTRAGSGGSFVGKDTFLRSIARVANKIRDIGQFHPCDGSIIVPPNETRAHFLRSGKNGTHVLSRNTLRAYFGVAVRVHKASSFMRCSSCLAMKLHNEDRVAVHRKVVSLMSELKNVKISSKRGKHVQSAARELARQRIGGAQFAELRARVRDEFPEEPGAEGVGEVVPTEEDVMDGDGNEEDVNRDVDEDAFAGLPENSEVDCDLEDRFDRPLSALEAKMLALHRSFLDDAIDVGAYLQGLHDDLKGLCSMNEAMKRFHYACVMNERVLVYAAQEAAASCPDDVAALIIDGCGKDRTKLPYFPDRMKKIATDPNLLKCPVYGIQEAIPIGSVSSSQHVGASDFELRTHDYIVALEWTMVGGSDLFASIILHYLLGRDCIPRVIVLVLDNAAVNKGEPFMAWLAYIMMRTHIEEIHLYFPTVGHTHTTLDAHFGKCKPKDRKQVLTPQALKRHLEELPRTRAILNFPLYEFATKLCDKTWSYSNRSQQHSFVLFKQKDTGDVLFKYSPLLRFAEHMTLRIRNLLRTHSTFLAMTDEERTQGIPVFRTDQDVLEDLEVFASATMPSPWTIPDSKADQLLRMITELHAKGGVGADVVDEIAELPWLAEPENVISLSEVLDEIKSKPSASLRALDADNAVDGDVLLSDLMRQVQITKRDDVYDTVDSDKRIDTPKLKRDTTLKVLEILKTRYPTIEQDFVDLASTHNSKGGMVKGYKKIVEQLVSDLGQAPTASTSRPSARASSSRASSVASTSVSVRASASPARPSARSPSSRASSVASTRGTVRASASPAPMGPPLTGRLKRAHTMSPLAVTSKKARKTDSDAAPPKTPTEDDVQDDAASTSSSVPNVTTRSGRVSKHKPPLDAHD